MRRYHKMISLLLSASMLLGQAGPLSAEELSADMAEFEITEEQACFPAVGESAPDTAPAEEIPAPGTEDIRESDAGLIYEELIQDAEDELQEESSWEIQEEVPGREAEMGQPLPLPEESVSQDAVLQEEPDFTESAEDSDGDLLSSSEPEMAGEGESGKGYWKKIGEDYFWVQEDGTILRKGCWQVLDGKRYFLANNSGRRKTGWVTYRNKKYYLDPETGVLVTGKQAIEGSWYYLKEDGSVPGEMMTGLIRRNGKLMFAQDNGKLCFRWRNVKGKKYYFDKNAEAVTEWQTIDGKRYFFDSKNCWLRTGWLTRGNNTYYLSKNGTPVTGYPKIDGKSYYFKAPYGIMYRGWLKVNNHRYYFGEDGARVYGLQNLGGSFYYFNPTWGYLEHGWKTISGNRCYFNSEGVMAIGLQNIGGKMYLFDANGALVTSRPAYKINGTYYRIDGEGVCSPLTRRVEILAAERLDQLGWSLPAAFSWAASMTYYRGAPETVPAGYSQAEFYAQYGFEHGYGHCYMMACVFYEMASMLGYRVKFLKGYVPSSSGGAATHGWVEIYYNGSWYICDPNFTYNTGRSGYMIYYGWSGTWRYVNYYVADQNF